MEVQVDVLGSDVDLKIVLILFLFSHVGFLTGCKLFILRVCIFVHILFEPYTLFEKSPFASHYVLALLRD